MPRWSLYARDSRSVFAVVRPCVSRYDSFSFEPLTQRIAFVTCEQLPDIHADDGLVAAALQRRGFQVEAAVWSDPGIDWRQFASVVIRSTWDYHLDEARYADWLRRCETGAVNLWNPAATVLANIDKRYLASFAEKGVPIVPIDYVERGQSQSLRTLLERRNWTRRRRQAGGVGERLWHLANFARDGGGRPEPFRCGRDAPIAAGAAVRRRDRHVG